MILTNSVLGSPCKANVAVFLLSTWLVSNETFFSKQMFVKKPDMKIWAFWFFSLYIIGLICRQEKFINGEKYSLEKKSNKKTFAPLTVVFDVLTVCTVEKNFYTEMENLLRYLTYFIINSFGKAWNADCFLLEDYKNTTGHAEDSYVLSGMLICLCKKSMDFTTHVHQCLYVFPVL